MMFLFASSRRSLYIWTTVPGSVPQGGKCTQNVDCVPGLLCTNGICTPNASMLQSSIRSSPSYFIKSKRRRETKLITKMANELVSPTNYHFDPSCVTISIILLWLRNSSPWYRTARRILCISHRLSSHIDMFW